VLTTAQPQAIASNKAVGIGDIVDVFKNILLVWFSETNSSIEEDGLESPLVSPMTLHGSPSITRCHILKPQHQSLFIQSLTTESE